MKPGDLLPRTPVGRAIILAILASGGIGYGVARFTAPSTSAVAGSASDDRKVLYWYDPMVPQERYDNPDSLSSMGMKTQPKYADENGVAGGPPGVSVDSAARQNLGIRLATVESGVIESDLTVTGTIDFNQRNVAVIQARANSFVQRVYNRAPGDVIGAGAPLADVLVPEWGARKPSIERCSGPAIERWSPRRVSACTCLAHREPGAMEPPRSEVRSVASSRPLTSGAA